MDGSQPSGGQVLCHASSASSASYKSPHWQFGTILNPPRSSFSFVLLPILMLRLTFALLLLVSAVTRLGHRSMAAASRECPSPHKQLHPCRSKAQASRRWMAEYILLSG
ncbi:hypothetical protein BJX76DRAFT_341131, partial [Aspergillus varians]